MSEFLSIAGGIALILFGARFLNKGLDRLVGGRMNHWTRKLTETRLGACGVGAIMSVLAPSSTTMAVLASQGVRDGRLDARRATALMLGTAIGLTVGVQIVALNVVAAAPALIFAGVVLFMYTQSRTSRGIGQILLSLGFIFLAMRLIGDGAHTAMTNPDMRELIELARRHPIVLAVIGAVITVAAQSSKASAGLLIAILAADGIGLQPAVGYIVGINIGLAVTRIGVSWTDLRARQMAVTVMLFTLLLTPPVIIFNAPLGEWLDNMPGPVGVRVGMFHTIFNIILAAAGLLLLDPGIALARRLVGEPDSAAEDSRRARYIADFPADRTALALGQSAREILRVSEVVRSMLDDTWLALKTRDVARARSVGARDDEVDGLDDEIRNFLIRVGQSNLEADDANEQMLQLRYIGELETIGDIIDKNLSAIVLKLINSGASFSAQGAEELDSYFRRIQESLLMAETLFLHRDPTLARNLVRHKRETNIAEHELRDQHLHRIMSGQKESRDTSAVHLDMLTAMRQINSRATAIAHELLAERNPDSP